MGGLIGEAHQLPDRLLVDVAASVRLLMGENVEVEIDGIGVISNPVRAAEQ